tara:strand:- start:65 stop:307 length:243 start_codon:yes stop_codon:yes gene_type:complete
MINNDNTKKSLNTLGLSDQALGAIMIALQNSLLNQTDIVPVLKGMKLVHHPEEGLVVTNPPILRTNDNSPEGGTIETSVQ